MKILESIWSFTEAVLLLALGVIFVITCMALICFSPVALILGYIELAKFIWHHI